MPLGARQQTPLAMHILQALASYTSHILVRSNTYSYGGTGPKGASIQVAQHDEIGLVQATARCNAAQMAYGWQWVVAFGQVCVHDATGVRAWHGMAWHQHGCMHELGASAQLGAHEGPA